MKIGEIYISKEIPLEDEFNEAIRLTSYDGDDLWSVEVGYLEDGVFILDDVDYTNQLEGKEIYENYIKSTEAFI